jgi:hypothetical protein
MCGQIHSGCMARWASLDDWGMRRGAGHNLVYFTGNGIDRALHVPAADVTMRKVLD